MIIEARQPHEAETLIRGRATAPASLPQFVPGTAIADRYRIVSLLGRGSMGEVYRADDLKLGVPVAMKFVAVHKGSPEHETFIDEVRVGRRLAHPNICRLHDISEVDDRVFITMEFIDGEDLASLLRRIGRLPVEKAISLARDLCAGLGAAHDLGIIHRDLKPSNVLVDGRGCARIVDFGLAQAVDERIRFAQAGTPAYMAPEQISGAPATPRTDVYALGLILYEIFTGRKACGDPLHPHIVPPSELVPDIGAQVERLILRCLDRDPAARPPTASAVLESLPGLDPIEARLVTGETPTAGMVAAARHKGQLRPATAWLMLFAAAVTTATGTMLLSRSRPPLLAPEVMADRARAVLRTAGADIRGSDAASNYFRGEEESMNLIVRNVDSTSRHLVTYVHRTSPGELRPAGRIVTASDPPLERPGMTYVRLDEEGRLLDLLIVPSGLRRPSNTQANWFSVVGHTGVDPESLVEVEALRYAPIDVDEHRAWRVPASEVRIEAASRAGQVVWLSTLDRRLPSDASGERFDRLTTGLSVAIIILLPIAAAFLARRNIRRGQGDRVGARRSATVYFAANTIAWSVASYHAGGLAAEFTAMTSILAYSLYGGAVLWLLYMAAEPYARRRWPRMLISWTRLISGRWTDPMVGRDVLIGCVAAGGAVLLAAVPYALGASATSETRLPMFHSALPLGSVRYAICYLVFPLTLALLRGIAIIAELLLLRAIAGKFATPLAVLLTAATIVDYFPGPAATRIAMAILSSAIVIAVAIRFGTLSVVTMSYGVDVLTSLPLSLDVESWFFDQSVFAVLLLSSIAFGAFAIGVGRQAWVPRFRVG